MFIELPSGRVGIEVKLQNAQAGEPTMYYSFTSESFNISSDIIRNYYSQKGAQFVQVKGKGLFHIKNPISLDIAGKKIRTTLFDFKSVMGLIQFRKTSDTRFAMRTQFKGNPLKSLPSSKVDLDKPDDLKAFIEYIAPGTSRNNEGPENLSIIKEFIKRSLLDVI